MDDVRPCVGARRVSSSSKHIPHPSKHVRLSAGPGAAIPNLLPRAGKAGPEEIGAGNGREERGRETAARSRRSCMRAGGSPASRALRDDCGISYSSRLRAAMPMFMHPDCACPSEGVHEGRLVCKNNAPWQSGAHICQVVARRMCIVSLLYMGVRGSLCNACRCGRYAVAITLPRGARIAWPPFESFHGGMLLHRSRDPRSPVSCD